MIYYKCNTLNIEMNQRAEFTRYQLDEFKEVYDLYCQKLGLGDYLNQDWAKRYLRSCGADPTPEDMTVLVSKHEKWYYPELLEELYVLLKDAESKPEIIKAFKVFDYNLDGYIAYVHLKFAMEEIGEKMSEEEYGVMVKYIKRECKHNDKGEFFYMDLVDLLFSDPVEYVNKIKAAHEEKLRQEGFYEKVAEYKRKKEEEAKKKEEELANIIGKLTIDE
jgi:Ca2+-binding EF-hand superfamily protein